ncbi:MAG: hypothetical protein ACFFDQ_03665 [Candidatus Thorarchaeota archaeon]
MRAFKLTYRKRMGLSTLISAIFIVASFIWTLYTLLPTLPVPRLFPAHFEYDQVAQWPPENVSLLIWPTNGQPYSRIGEPFNLSAAIMVDDVPVTALETIVFYDETDSILIGSASIGQPPDLPIANITYTFPRDASIDYHIISATWITSMGAITNWTSISCVGIVVPFSYPTHSIYSKGLIPSETIALKVVPGIISRHQNLALDLSHMTKSLQAAFDKQD